MAKGIYVGADSELPNLVVNGDFSNGITGWNNAHSDYCTMEAVNDNGEKALKVTITKSITTAVPYQTISSINETDIFYFCGYGRGDVNNVDTSGSNYISICLTSTTPSFVETNSEYVFTSKRSTITNASANTFQRLQLYNRGENAVGNVYYWKDIKCYNLTAAYGAGNEPTKEWCDETVAKYGKLIKTNISHKVKNVYVGVAEDSLVVNGDFSNGLNGWSSGTNSPKTTLTLENGYLKTVVNTASNIYVFSAANENPISINSNHVYYGAVDLKISSSVSSNISASLFGNATTTYAIKDNNWHTLSLYGKPSTTSTTWNPYIIELESAKVGDIVYVDNMKVYDLTAIYGAGDEPTQEWCEANLETLKMLHKTKSVGVARKVTKGYIGVNGIAQKFYENLTLTQTTVATATMKLNSFSSGAKTLKGSISGLSSTYKPTVTWTTSASNGFVMASQYDDTSEAIAFTIYVNGSSKTTSLSTINTRLSSTTYDSDTYMLIGGTGECTGTYTVTMLIDFGIARSFTINAKSPTGTGHAGKLTCYVSSNNSTWTTLSAGSRATSKRYCKIQLSQLEALEAYPWSYFYFSNITDWIYQ